MKIVVLVSSYYPYYTSIGKCLRNLIQEFEKKHEVIVISNMNRLGLLAEEDYSNHKIIRIRTQQMRKRDLLEHDLKNNKSIHKIILRLKILWLRFYGALKIVLSKVSVDQDLCHEYLDVLSQIDDVDLIMPTCYPFEAIVAAQSYLRSAKSPAKLLPILFDKFSESPTLHRLKINQQIKYKRHLDLEESMIQNASRIFYVESWKDQMGKHFGGYSEKVQYIDHPLIVEIDRKESIKDPRDENIDIVYAGVLDKKVRPPNKSLEVISGLIDLDSRIKFHFYEIGNCGDIIRKYQKLYPDNLFDHGYIESESVLRIMAQSDLLLSIGNTDISLIPSKIYEYMSLGKPVLHFYTDPHDPLIEMLKSYHLAICVDQNEEHDNRALTEILTYIRENKNRVMEFQDVKELFKTATPEYVANLVLRNSYT